MQDKEVVWFVTEEERNMYLEDINNEPRTESLEFMGIKVLKNEDTINWLRSENAYLRGKIYAYEKFLKDKEYIKEDDVQEKEN